MDDMYLVNVANVVQYIILRIANNTRIIKIKNLNGE